MGTNDDTGSRGSAREGTVYVAVEVSRKSWVVGVHVPELGGGVGLHHLPAADVAGLAALIGRARETRGHDPSARPRVLCGYVQRLATPLQAIVCLIYFLSTQAG